MLAVWQIRSWGRASAVIVASAAIATLPVRAEGADWSGWYAGVSAGGGSADLYDDLDENGIIDQTQLSGAVAGLHIGHNWQYGALVFGIEGDFSWSNVKFENSIPPPFGSTYTDTQDWFSSLRSRIGFSQGPLLIFGTAGLAFAEITGDYQTDSGPDTGEFDSNKVVEGIVGGGGIEWAFNGNWSLRGEALWYSLGDSFRFTEPQSFDGFIGRGGLSYKFGAPSDGSQAAAQSASIDTDSDWSGLYVGLNGGGGIAQLGVDGAPQMHGGLAGGHLGYNWQAESLVYGIEADFDWSDIEHDYVVGRFGPAIFTATLRQDWSSSFRGRIGVSDGPVLVYATFGLVFAGVSLDDVDGAERNTLEGIVGGAGLDWALNRNWSVRGEALWSEVGRNFKISGEDGIGVFTGRGGLSYRF